MTQTSPSFKTDETRRRRAKAQNNPPTSSTTTAKVLTWAQHQTGTHYFPGLEPSDEPKPALEDLLKAHRETVDELSVRFPAYGDDLTKVKVEPVRWLWQNRIPLAGITLLDGDHGTGKSLLALQIAAHVSSGQPMPDGTPTIQGGVVIISPNTDAITSQLQILTALGADLSRIKILSFIQQAAPEFHTGGYQPFTLPEDYLSLYEAIIHVKARLIIFDPFVTILSREQRLTNEIGRAHVL